MKYFFTKSMLAIIVSMLFLQLSAQEYNYSDVLSPQGLTLNTQSGNKVLLNHGVQSFALEDVIVDGVNEKAVKMPGVFLPNDAGFPDLAGNGQYIAIPQGADASFKIIHAITETIKNVKVAPAPVIPLDTDNGPLVYQKNEEVFNSNTFYPDNPVKLSPPTQLRGVDVVMIGITPFQYNPVTQELIVYKELEIEISIEGGNGQVGDNRLRSRWWDPIVKNAVINPESIPEVDYSKPAGPSETPDYEYLIIIPNQSDFIAWADSIKKWRTLQGIATGVVTTTDLGGNSVAAIESYVDNAYNTWAVPPAAVLLLSDYSTTSSGIISHMYSHPAGYPAFASDNKYADVNGDDLPDIAFARITANNAAQLEVMITKFLDYERNPPTSSDFYNHPITALGWQTERWFQICSETVGGYLKNVKGKNPVRINAIYSGTPGSVWSTATNTSTVVNYFGPSGLGYIPASPSELGGFSGGTAAAVVSAINNGSYILQHRDHGFYGGWGEPDFTSTNINSLNNVNNELTYVFSINCQTGAFHNTSESFAEKFHRHTYNGQNSGALGILAATEVSYSFVNDTYVWGLFDNMHPDFMPGYTTTFPVNFVMPAFANAAGKHFLYQSSWPYNTGDKLITYRLFHHHGDAFMTLYTEVPQSLTVNHPANIISGATTFSITADAGSFIALTANDQILATANGTGSTQLLSIPTLNPGDEMIVTVTKQDYFRYAASVHVLPPSGPYLTYVSHVVNDVSGNNNGEVDFGESILLGMTIENQGTTTAYGTEAELSTSNTHTTVTDNTQSFGDINAGNTAYEANAYAFDIASDVPDQEVVNFDLNITVSNDEEWLSAFNITVNAPSFAVGDITIDDATGNGNGLLDPGETVDIIIESTNEGHADAGATIANLTSSNPFVTINSSTQNFSSVSSGATVLSSFNVSIDGATPIGTNAALNFSINFGAYGANNTFNEVIGQIPVVIINLDPNNTSAPSMETAMNSLGLQYDIYTSIPGNLNLYSAAFVCLGIYSSNHVLTSTEGQTLANYLGGGGQLYIEGGDTWYYDPQTSVHPMFSINAEADGTSDMGTVVGQPGTFTASMSYSYVGENNWMDHISGASTAYNIFENQSPNYGCAVAYDGGGYKTIGASFEFGGLSDGTSPSTKEDLMYQYLDFFGLIGTPIPPPEIDVNPLSFNVSLNTDESTTETLSISNLGQQDLNYSISVSGADFTLGKVSQQLTQEQKESLRYKKDYSNQTDELTLGAPNPDNWVLPPFEKYGAIDNKGEETFGSWTGGSYSGGTRDRGNIFHVTSTVTLEEIRFYLSIGSSTQLYFFVYEGNATAGSFTQIEEVYVASSGTGEGWYSSGTISVELTAGNYYYIGTSWNGTATYGRGTETVPLATSFGTLETGIPGSIAGYPPGPTCNNTYTGTSPYYQTLVTSSTPVFNWLIPSPLSGNVAGYSSEDIDVTFDATGLASGTYTKDLVITSNDPDEPTITIPCTLNVVEGGFTLNAKAFLEGPFVSTEMVPIINYFGGIPLNQPYNTPPWNYNGSESVGAIPSFDVVDWVLVELRETDGGAANANPATMIEQQAGFILKDGTIVSTDGSSPLSFTAQVSNDLYIVIYHRNHLGIMASQPAILSGGNYSYDFTTDETMVMGHILGLVEMETGIWGMRAGDGNADGEVNNLDKTEVWHLDHGNTGYLYGDFDMNYQVDNTDKNVKWKANAGKCSYIVK